MRSTKFTRTAAGTPALFVLEGRNDAGGPAVPAASHAIPADEEDQERKEE